MLNRGLSTHKEIRLRLNHRILSQKKKNVRMTEFRSDEASVEN